MKNQENTEENAQKDLIDNKNTKKKSELSEMYRNTINNLVLKDSVNQPKKFKREKIYNIGYQKNGILFCNLGVYLGEIVNGEMHGEGRLNCLNGDHFIGKFKDGKFDGIGTFDLDSFELSCELRSYRVMENTLIGDIFGTIFRRKNIKEYYNDETYRQNIIETHCRPVICAFTFRQRLRHILKKLIPFY